MLHSVMQSDNGVEWYAMQPKADAPRFEQGDAAIAYNQAEFRQFMPGFEEQIVAVDSDIVMTGISKFVTKMVPVQQHSMIPHNLTRPEATTRSEDAHGKQWIAIHGDAAVERRPVYENGQAVYDGENVKTVSVETVRYKNTPSRFQRT